VIDLYIRQTGWTDVNHIKTTAEPLDGTWHHITFVQQTDGARVIYIDGVADALEIAPKPEGLGWSMTRRLGDPPRFRFALGDGAD
jgi:hypothetical protein